MSEPKKGQLSVIQEIDDKMEPEDQFCLQWNDHKSTLVTVFESLLESGTLVDCSLAAEGQYLKAHKVVLSACSPYFELLFSEHKEKHPILILKDVKFQELKALMDYMYRGEVNIPQDRLRALLETAESLQIKGLGGCKSRSESPRPKSDSDCVEILPITSNMPSRSRDALPSTRIASPEHSNTRKGSVSPTPRKRSRHHLHTSAEEETSSHVQTSDSPRSEVPARPCPPPHPPSSLDVTPLPLNPVSVSAALGSGGSTTVSSIRREWLSRDVEGSSSPMQSNVLPRADLSTNSHSDLKSEPVVEIMLTPKTEYVEGLGDEDTTENSIQLDDGDYITEPRSGPSHLDESSSNQGPGFAPWLSVAEWAVNEGVPPPAVGAYREPQGSAGTALLGSSSWWTGYQNYPLGGAAVERKKKRCAFCPRFKDRKTTIYCATCLRPMCTSHRLKFDLCRVCAAEKLGITTLNEIDRI